MEITTAEEYLRFIAGFHSTTNQHGQGYEEFVLQHGRAFQAAPRPKGVRKQRDKMCFSNAFHLAESKGYIYVEGWAISFIPAHHAWCVTPDGIVVDPTWRKPEGASYFGVPFRKEYLYKVMCESNTYGVFFKRETHDLALHPDTVDVTGIVAEVK